MAEEFLRDGAVLEQMRELRRQFDAAADSWDAEHGPDSARAVEFASSLGGDILAITAYLASLEP